MELHIVADAGTAAREAAHYVARKVWPAVHRRGRFTLAVSGGSTPAAMFAALAEEPDVPWGTVHLFQVDERVAAAGHPDRNATQLSALPVPVANVHLMEVEWGDRRLAVSSYAAALPDRLDVVHLGLGDDGHTASWPPGDPVVDSKLAVAAVRRFNGRDRITITPMVVNARAHAAGPRDRRVQGSGGQAVAGRRPCAPGEPDQADQHRGVPRRGRREHARMTGAAGG